MHIAVRYGACTPLLMLCGLGPRQSGVDVDADSVTVAMGWGFRATFARSSIASVAVSPRRRWNIGVHAWRGTWLVNGATTGIVALELSEIQRCRLYGIPFKLRRLLVSAEEPERLVALLR